MQPFFERRGILPKNAALPPPKKTDAEKRPFAFISQANSPAKKVFILPKSEAKKPVLASPAEFAAFAEAAFSTCPLPPAEAALAGRFPAAEEDTAFAGRGIFRTPTVFS